jgi:hypothetical protein
MFAFFVDAGVGRNYGPRYAATLEVDVLAKALIEGDLIPSHAWIRSYVDMPTELSPFQEKYYDTFTISVRHNYRVSFPGVSYCLSICLLFIPS